MEINMLYKIITPNPTFTGERAGVTFIAGIAYTSDALAADELRRMGYIVSMVAEFVPLAQTQHATVNADKPKPRQRKATQERT
jgi:hypothetical protein